MQQNHTFREFLNRNLYLLMIAAWMITFAIIIDNYWSPNSSLKSVRKKLTSFINKSENDLGRLVKNTRLLNTIKEGRYDEKTIKNLIAKPYSVFFYKIDSSGQFNPILWNTQRVFPFPWLLYEKEKSSFVKLPNGYFILNTFYGE